MQFPLTTVLIVEDDPGDDHIIAHLEGSPEQIVSDTPITLDPTLRSALTGE